MVLLFWDNFNVVWTWYHKSNQTGYISFPVGFKLDFIRINTFGLNFCCKDSFILYLLASYMITHTHTYIFIIIFFSFFALILNLFGNWSYYYYSFTVLPHIWMDTLFEYLILAKVKENQIKIFTLFPLLECILFQTKLDWMITEQINTYIYHHWISLIYFLLKNVFMR